MSTKKQTTFAIGRRWLANPRSPHIPRFYFVIAGPGINYAGKPDPNFKLCKIELHPDDAHLYDLVDLCFAMEEHYFSHKYIKKNAVMVSERKAD